MCFCLFQWNPLNETNRNTFCRTPVTAQSCSRTNPHRNFFFPPFFSQKSHKTSHPTPPHRSKQDILYWFLSFPAYLGGVGWGGMFINKKKKPLKSVTGGAPPASCWRPRLPALARRHLVLGFFLFSCFFFLFLLLFPFLASLSFSCFFFPFLLLFPFLASFSFSCFFFLFLFLFFSGFFFCRFRAEAQAKAKASVLERKSCYAFLFP